jgi:hypothetical protein
VGRDSSATGLDGVAEGKSELIGGACGSAREERGGDKTGRRKLKRKTHFREGANGTWAKRAG